MNENRNIKYTLEVKLFLLRIYENPIESLIPNQNQKYDKLQTNSDKNVYLSFGVGKFLEHASPELNVFTCFSFDS